MRLDDTMSYFVGLLAQAKQGFVTALPNLVTAIIVMAVGWVVARMLRSVVLGIFRRVASRITPEPTRQAWAEAVDDQKAGRLAADGVYWLVLLTAFVVAIDALDLPVFRRWMGALASFLPRFGISAALVLGGVVVGRLASNAIARTAFRMSPSQARGLARLTHVSIVVAAALIAASQLGLDVSLLTNVFLIALSAVLGSGALAFALGARGVMANILAMHYVNRSYRIGQLIRIGVDQGRIVRTTRTAVYLESSDGELSIPGREFAESRCVLLSEETTNDA